MDNHVYLKERKGMRIKNVVAVLFLVCCKTLLLRVLCKCGNIFNRDEDSWVLSFGNNISFSPLIHNKSKTIVRLHDCIERLFQ